MYLMWTSSRLITTELRKGRPGNRQGRTGIRTVVSRHKELRQTAQGRSTSTLPESQSPRCGKSEPDPHSHLHEDELKDYEYCFYYEFCFTIMITNKIPEHQKALLLRGHV